MAPRFQVVIRTIAQFLVAHPLSRLMLVFTLFLLHLSAQAIGAERTRNVICESTAGSWTAEVHPSWSPNGAKRYLELVRDGFFDNTPLFRAVPGFLVQFGISMNRSMNEKLETCILDDPFPIHVEMKKGIMAYAGNGKNSRNYQVWIGYEGASGLGGAPWETPFAEIVDGFENVEHIYSGYGATRYLEMVADGFFDNMPLFRAIPGFLVQFGISTNHSMNAKFHTNIEDDPFPSYVKMKKGIMAFVGYGKNSRSSQVWIGYEGAAGLGHSPWETPFGEIVTGMSNVEHIYGGYDGANYVKQFPKLDFIKSCYILKVNHPNKSQLVLDF
eukprot:gene22137-29199_t